MTWKTVVTTHTLTHRTYQDPVTGAELSRSLFSDIWVFRFSGQTHYLFSRGLKSAVKQAKKLVQDASKP